MHHTSSNQACLAVVVLILMVSFNIGECKSKLEYYFRCKKFHSEGQLISSPGLCSTFHVSKIGQLIMI